jgi:hypothetical protein
MAPRPAPVFRTPGAHGGAPPFLDDARPGLGVLTGSARRLPTTTAQDAKSLRQRSTNDETPRSGGASRGTATGIRNPLHAAAQSPFWL